MLTFGLAVNLDRYCIVFVAQGVAASGLTAFHVRALAK